MTGEEYTPGPLRCSAEDQGGHSCCSLPPTLQTKGDPGEQRIYYCHKHSTNRHVWREDELEPMHPTREMVEALTRAYDEAVAAHDKTATRLHTFRVAVATALGKPADWWKERVLLREAERLRDHAAKTCGTE